MQKISCIMDTAKVVVELTASKDGKQKDLTEKKHKNFRLTTNCQTNHCQDQQGKEKKRQYQANNINYSLFIEKWRGTRC